MMHDRADGAEPSFWRRAGFKLGGSFGVVLGLFLEWYFNWGPAALTPDRGEAQSYWVFLAGFPFTFLVSPLAAFLPAAVTRLLVILGVGVTWAIIGTALESLVPSRRAV